MTRREKSGVERLAESPDAGDPSVVVERDPSGYEVLFSKNPGDAGWSASALDFLDCVVMGDTRDEVADLISQRIRFRLEALSHVGEPCPRPGSWRESRTVPPAPPRGDDSARSWWETAAWFTSGGAALGLVLGVLSSLGGTNPETGEPMVPLTVIVDSTVERVTWSIGAGAVMGALFFTAVVAWVYATSLVTRKPRR